MKVLFVVGLPELGGSNKSLLTLIEGLQQKQCEPFVVLSMKGPLSDVLGKIGVCHKVIYHRLALYPDLFSFKDYYLFIPRLLYTIFVNIIAYFKLISLLKSVRPDIVHTNVSCINIGYFAAKRLHIPHVWHVREFNTIDFNRTPFPSLSCLKNRISRSNPIYITKGIGDFYNSTSRSTIIYNGIQICSNIQPLEFEYKYFLHVGGITAQKGVETTITSFAEFSNNHSGYKLLLVGGCLPEYRVKLDCLIDKLGIKDRISFVGVVSNVQSYMISAEALIVSSFFEAFGRITAEAMASKCIVIGRNTAGTKEQFDNGVLYTGREIGLRFDVDGDLCGKMEELVEMDHTVKEKMKIDAFNTVRELYSPNKYVNSIYNIYLNLYNREMYY